MAIIPWEQRHDKLQWLESSAKNKVLEELKSGSICGENGQVTVLIETLLQSEEWFHPEVLSVHSFHRYCLTR